MKRCFIIVMILSLYFRTEQLIRLWCHEVYRVFYDRLISDFDREDFFQLVGIILLFCIQSQSYHFVCPILRYLSGCFYNFQVKKYAQSFFKVELVKILFPHVLGGSSVVEDEHLRSLCFGDYMHPEAEKKIYDEIPDVTLLTKAMDHYLKVVFLVILILHEHFRRVLMLFMNILNHLSLQEYNTVATAPMPLVMFRFAVEVSSI